MGVPGEARVAKIVTQGTQMVPKSDPKKTKLDDSVFLSMVPTNQDQTYYSSTVLPEPIDQKSY